MSTVPTAVVTKPTAAAASRSPLPAPKVLLEGPTGTGKTFILGSLADTLLPLGGQLAVLAMEQGVESLYGYWTDRGLPVPPNLFVHEVASPGADFATLAEGAKLVNQLSFEALIKSTDYNRGKFDQFVKVLQAMNNFADSRTGQVLGPVDKWSTGRWLAIDGLTGLSNAAMNLFVGGRIAMDQKDWGLGQRNLENFLRMLTTQCRCGVVLLSHVERETDPVMGGSKITVSTIGRALAPKIPPMFSDVILTIREGTSWYWDTANVQADLKTRNLPINSKIVPGFRQILEKWNSRGGIVEAS